MHFYRFLLGALFVWRITHLLSAEDGPWDIVIRIRFIMGPGFLGQLFDCFYCLSAWVAAPLAFFMGEKTGERILLWPALSAGAILLERITNTNTDDPIVYYIEDSEG